MLWTELIKNVKGEIVKGVDGAPDILRLSADSREEQTGSLFFCLDGGEKDGHAFAEQAVEKGALAVVCNRKLDIPVWQLVVDDTRAAMSELCAEFYGNPSRRLKLIGITGTNGKTTTAHMLASILQFSGRNTGIIGTLGVTYNGNTYPSPLTTPDPIFLQKTLAEMFINGVEYVVMEVSAHALYYNKVSGLRFSACIFTNFTQDHLDFFATMQAYKAAKMRLFDCAVCPVAIVNGDDEVGREIGKLREKQGGKTLYYGLDTPSDAFAVISCETLFFSKSMFNINDKLCRVSLSFTGRHNVYNALAAAACAVETGIDVEEAAQGLFAIKGVHGRLQFVTKWQGANIFVDFAHTSDGLEKTLDALREHCKGRLICLFGCGGNRDKSKRPVMGETVAKKCDFAVLTSDNPRYEDPLTILGDIEKGYRRFSVKYVVVPERRTAISYAIDFLQENDVLLVAGKGGERYQEIMGIKYPFDDNDIIKTIIGEKTAKNAVYGVEH